MVLFLSESDVEAAITMDDALRSIRAVFVSQGEGRAESTPRHHVKLNGTRLGVQGAVLEHGWAGAKVNVTTADLTRTWSLLYDGDATLLCMAHARRLGQLRTAAATGISVDVLARKDARTLAIIGTGFHGYTQVEAVTRLRPDLRVLVFGRTPERSEDFAERLRNDFGLVVETRPEADAAVAEADVVVTMTRSSEPVFHGEHLRPGAHVALVGSNDPRKRESDATVFERAARVYTDDLEQARLESGDLIAAVDDGALSWDRVELLGAAVAEADVNGTGSARTDPEAITVFSSHGIALWDAAITAEAFRRALELGVGFELPLDGSAGSKER
jgi:ornithine cyclodeaminase